MGESTKQFKRIKSNLVRKDNQVPVLRGTSKDHKEAIDKTLGPDFRPIMGAMVGPNVGLSEIGSCIVRKIADNADKGLVAKSTEEVLSKFEEFNKTRMERVPGIKKLIVGSMDIEKFYPNILSEESADIVRRMWEESNLPLEMDGEILNMYLSKHLSKEEIAQEKFEDILYTKKPKEKKKVVSKKIRKSQVKKKTMRRNWNQDKKEYKVKERRDTNFMEGADTPVNVAEVLDNESEIEDNYW